MTGLRHSSVKCICKTIPGQTDVARYLGAFFAALFWLTGLGKAAPLKTLTGHVPQAVRQAHRLGRLEDTNQLRLALSLPLRDRVALTNLLRQLYDPASPRYHHYLTPEQFTEQFGPSAADYQAVIDFAKQNGLRVDRTHGSRLLLDVRGGSREVEKAFHVTLHKYQHPTEARHFYAPEAEPSVEATLPIENIFGLTDYPKLEPMGHAKPGMAGGAPAAGSQGSGNYMGSDFRHAYAPGVTLNGAGQMVGLFEADGYFTNDIASYKALAGLPDVPLVNVLIDGFNGAPGSDNFEVALDIEMAISMAPGVSAVVVFEAPNAVSDWIDILDSMASSNQIKQFSSSWGYTSGVNPNNSFDNVFQTMAAQGQSFFQASGDGEAWTNPIWVPADSPYVTSVGGTGLVMNGAGVSYSSETTWNSGNLGAANAWAPNGNGNWGSGGGISTVYNIPSWQQSLNMTNNGGSTTHRNIPDVSIVADNVWVIYHNGGVQTSGAFMGTSISAPLWAGFIAMANQQAVSAGDPPVGFINPAIYALGQSGNYSSCFNDIATGNNTWSNSPASFYAVGGFDLCTGWGTPTGSNLINTLAPADALVILPTAGFVSSGGAGGPFSVTSQNFTLTNVGAAPFNWVAVSGAPWLTCTPSNGTLAPGAPLFTVTVSLNTVASNEVVGSYSNAIWFTNLNDNFLQSRPFALTVLAPPSLTALPTNQAAVPGTTVVFTAAATGAAPLTYHWQLNGTNLSDNAFIFGSSTTNLTLANVAATNAGSYTVAVSNTASVITSAPPAVLTILPSQQLIQNGGFETGDFSFWLQGGNTADTDVSTGIYAHSGHYGAQLGPATTDGYLSQTLATVPGQLYAISLWVRNTFNTFPNEFSVVWAGSTIFSQTNIPANAWTNLVFSMPATATNTVLQLGFRDDNTYLGLDDVSVLPLKPTLLPVGYSGGTYSFSWLAVQGRHYQVQSSTDLTQTTWASVGGLVVASNVLTTISDPSATNAGRYYRILVLP